MAIDVAQRQPSSSKPDRTAWSSENKMNQALDLMSEEQLKAFLEKVKADTSLQEKLKAAADSDAVLAIAKEAGFAITAEDIQSMQSATTELSDDELEGVTGGFFDAILPTLSGICAR